MTFDPGDVLVVPLPFTDGSATKRRPVLVLSSRTYNEGEDVIVCAITSNPKASTFSVRLEPQDMSKPQLPRASRVKVGRVATIEKDLVERVMGRVKPDVMQQIWKEFHGLLAAQN